MMSVLHRQNELKLDILRSLARSQRALAEIVEIIAPVMAASVHGTSSAHQAGSDHLAQQILAHMGSLSEYQHALAQKLSGIEIRQVKKGRPCQPWLAPSPYFLRSAKSS
ncbi:MAG: hypothetical protein WD469_02370 [Paenibacillaceae bacterium]